MANIGKLTHVEYVLPVSEELVTIGELIEEAEVEEFEPTPVS